MAKSERIALKADPNDPEDFDVTKGALAQAHAERAARRRAPGRPIGSDKERIAIRLDKEVLERLRAGGAGWQTRANDMLRKAVGL